MDRLKRYYGCGIWAGKLFVIVVVVDYLIYCLLELMYPRDKIDICKPWPKESTAASRGGEGYGMNGGVEGYDRTKMEHRKRNGSAIKSMPNGAG